MVCFCLTVPIPERELFDGRLAGFGIKEYIHTDGERYLTDGKGWIHIPYCLGDGLVTDAGCYGLAVNDLERMMRIIEEQFCTTFEEEGVYISWLNMEGDAYAYRQLELEEAFLGIPVEVGMRKWSGDVDCLAA
jgi:hypothetical protein